jgi:inner membrane protein
MDNVTHTLVGAALAQSGLRRRTPFALATLLIAANIPDVDGALYWVGASASAYGFRRGWTHGILALALWPFALTAAVLAWDRLVRRRRRPDAEPARPGTLLGLALLGVATHPLLDYCNTYGVRWLMPFSDRWAYGDALFIVDPWVWLGLGIGVWWSARRWREGAPGAARPARWALALCSAYAAAMFAGSALARRVATAAIERSPASHVSRILASPEGITPFARPIVADIGDRYVVGTVTLLPRPRFTADARSPIVKRDDQPGVAEASRTPLGASFLRWARFPFFEVERRGGTTLVHIVDARYTLDPEARFGALTVTVPAAIPSPAGPPTQEPHP